MEEKSEWKKQLWWFFFAQEVVAQWTELLPSKPVDQVRTQDNLVVFPSLFEGKGLYWKENVLVMKDG